MAVTYRRIESTDPRLNRHVRHDDASWNYRFPTEGLSIVSAKHTRRIPVLDQGQLGSCTGNAGIGCLGTDPFYATVPSRVQPLLVAQGAYPFTEEGAVQLYSDATAADDYPGQYPPTDTGSDGLTIAKVLTARGQISGYQHTFTLKDALLALTQTPFITGVNWYENMFDPDQDGRVYPTGDLAGGHEFVADELDVENKRIWFSNSWGKSWGVNGRFYLTWDDYAELLSQQGDVTIFVPLTQPAPTPTPPVPPAPANWWAELVALWNLIRDDIQKFFDSKEKP
jgi:hypothetical protein